MKEINWRKIAEDHHLTPKEFEKEIYTMCCALASMDIDKSESVDGIQFTCSDNKGRIQLTVERVL